MAYQDEVLADLPLAYYRLGESSGTTVADSSGNGVAGSYVGGPTLGVVGAVVGDTDTAVGFNGSSQYVNLGDNFDIVNGSFTIELWYKTTTGTFVRLFDKRGTGAFGTKPGLQLATSSGAEWNNTVLEAVGGQFVQLPAVSMKRDGKWTHAVLTWDNTSGTLSLYIDGAPLTSATNAAMVGADCSTALNVNLARATTNAQYFSGSLDEVAVYGQALSAARVEAHYRAATPTLGSLAGVAPAVVGSFDAAAATVATLGGVAPAVSGGFSGTATTPPVATDTTYSNLSGYTYTGVGQVDYTPPVAPTPARVRRVKVQHIHQSLPAPTLENGRPV